MPAALESSAPGAVEENGTRATVSHTRKDVTQMGNEIDRSSANPAGPAGADRRGASGEGPGERGPAPVKPQGFGLETQTELPHYSPGYGNNGKAASLTVHTQADGKGPLKGPGLQISGAVTGVEHKDGLTTIRYEAAGRAEAVSFPTHRRAENGREEPNPLNAVADVLKEGDRFGLRIGRDGNATLSDASKETRIQFDGRVESKPLEPDRGRSQDRGITRDPPA